MINTEREISLPEQTSLVANRSSLGNDKLRGKLYDVHPLAKIRQEMLQGNTAETEGQQTIQTSKEQLIAFWESIGIDRESIRANLNDSDRSGIIIIPDELIAS